MRHKLLFLLVAMLVTALPANAYDFKVDGLCYDINNDGTTVSVTYENKSDYSGIFSSYYGDVVVPYCVTNGDTPYSVTAIGNSAFCNSRVKSVTIPNTVTSIGDYAFYDCEILTSITIPNSVTSIGKGAFSCCKILTSITIPNSVTYIGKELFKGSTALQSVEVVNGNRVYDSRESCNAIIETASNTLINACNNTFIPNSVTAIGDHAFADCKLTSITIPVTVTTIGDSAFYRCGGLTSITIPASVTKIGEVAFGWCSQLTNVTWNARSIYAKWDVEGYVDKYKWEHSPFYGSYKIKSFVFGEMVEEIPSYLCYKQSLTSVTIPKSVTSIDGSAFYRCTKLTSVTWNAKSCKDIEHIIDSGGSDYDGFFPYATSFTFGEEVKRIPAHLCSESDLTSVTIPNSVTSIGNKAFAGCTRLKSVTIGNSVTTIGKYTFYSCFSLKNVTIPNSVTSIGDYAFLQCSGLTHVGIPNSVTSIGNEAFAECTRLTSVTIGNSVTTIGNSAFQGCSGLTSVTIGNSVTSIGKSAFYRCKLTSVIIPNSVTTIGNWAFSENSSLKSISIGNTVSSIGDGVFGKCWGLTSIASFFDPKRVSTGDNIFEGVSGSCSLHVLPKYLSDFKVTTPWRNFQILGDLSEDGVVGDVNGDILVSGADVTALYNVLLNGTTPTGNADVNGDGFVNGADVTALYNLLLKQ